MKHFYSVKLPLGLLLPFHLLKRGDAVRGDGGRGRMYESQRGHLVFNRRSVSMWGEMIVFACAAMVGEGLISRSDRKCLCRCGHIESGIQEAARSAAVGVSSHVCL